MFSERMQLFIWLSFQNPILKSFQHQKSFTLKVLSEQYSVFEIQSVHFGINVMYLISTYYHGNAKKTDLQIFVDNKLRVSNFEELETF